MDRELLRAVILGTLAGAQYQVPDGQDGIATDAVVVETILAAADSYAITRCAAALAAVASQVVAA